MKNNSHSIGEKTTFWKLVKGKISIPTLQRDYIYGAGTEKTEEVLNHMLDTFQRAIESGNEETLDFVYGSESKANEFMPLDGQQRLTTLYLLHYYAALKADFTEEEEKEAFETLSRFSYATRNSTITFCSQLLIDKHKEIKKTVIDAKEDYTFSTYLTDLDEFRGSFFADPSVMSMLVVLDRIHSRFNGVKLLWECLTSDTCPINFYLLDFGDFDLSDDLYNKMNSRGKPLTDFEISKAKMHKQIGKWNKTKADTIAIQMDTNWMQFIWETVSSENEKEKELKQIDPAYIRFLKNLFRCFDYFAGYDTARFAKLDDDCLTANAKSAWRMKAMESVFDTLANKKFSIPVEIVKVYNATIKECIEKDASYNGLFQLYSIYLGLYYGLTSEEFYLRFRHVRNLVNNSVDNIRENYMHELFEDVTRVMQGKLLKHSALKLNVNSWKEEQEKERHREVWKQFFEYEDIDEINGSINAFAAGLNETNTLALGDLNLVDKMLVRIRKAACFFSAKMDEHQRRSALLSLGCYAMTNKDRALAYRYFGIVKSSWQNFTGYHRFDERYRIMSVFDKIDLSCDVQSMVGDVSRIQPENWRYYAVKYAKTITVGNRNVDYGYMYFFGVDEQHPFDENQGYLDVAILQSSYYSTMNVAWKMMHRILEQECNACYHMYLGHLGADRIYLSKISNDAQMEMKADGWHLIGISQEDLDEIGLPYVMVQPAQKELQDENGQVIEPGQLCDCLIIHNIGSDYIDEGKEILARLSKKYEALVKSK